VSAEELDERLLDHLLVEFLDHGQRAVDFLLSAQALLAVAPADVPRTADAIAYCLREAMKAIPASEEATGGGSWRTVSRSVVEARKRFELTRSLPGQDSEAALVDLLARIDDMERSHNDATIHQERLIAVIVSRTGAQPLATGVTPVRAYQELLSKLDEAVHRDGVSLDDVKQLWVTCTGLLRQLFSPPELRNSALDELAAVMLPGPGDASRLETFLAAPNHLQYFLSRIQSPAWLELMADSELLQPPTGQAPWPVFAAVTALRDEHGVAVAAVLLRLLARWGTNPQQAFNVARAATALMEHGEPVILQALRNHPTQPGIAIAAILATGKDYATAGFVDAVADITLNPPLWTQSSLYVDPLLQALIKGLDPDNYGTRLTLLCYKLRALERGSQGRVSIYLDSGDDLEHPPDYLRREPFYALVRTLVESLRKAWEWSSTNDLLSAVAALPDDLKGRVRTWLLAHAPSVEPTDLIEEVALALSSRYVTPDDLRVLDRAVAECDPADYKDPWVSALGIPPTVAALSTALASGEVPFAWRHIFGWTAVLPREITKSWRAAVAIMAAAWGHQPTRPSLESSESRSAAWSQSPISETDLRALPVDEAARRIATWRFDPSRGLVTARELGRTLQVVVKTDVASWGAFPVQTASQLQHPTYIHHYILGLAEADDLRGVPAAELIDLIALVRAHPWPAFPLGEDAFDYDSDWRPAEHATIELIKTMARTDVGFDSRRDEMWIVLQGEIQDRSEPAGVYGDDIDPLQRAINRPCTRALEAALSFLAHEYRLDGTVRSEARDTLSGLLTIEGDDGTEYRAILAPRIAFLRHVASDWVDQSRDELFGEAAPGNLGQTTVDLALRWGQPNRWLMEHYQVRIEDAVTRGARQARDHYLVATLWQVPGYTVPNAVHLFASKHLLSEAGRTLGRLVRTDDIDPEIVDRASRFWQMTLQAKPTGSLAGFGWFAEARALDTETWLDLTLETIAASPEGIDWPDKVSERAAEAQPPTVKVLDILNRLVRGPAEEWERHSIAERAKQTLDRAQDLAGSAQYKRLHTTLAERGFF
jgi:hypothetical protein